MCRLKVFVADAVEPYRSELKALLYPMFVHVYLELLCNGQKTPGKVHVVKRILNLKANNLVYTFLLVVAVIIYVYCNLETGRQYFE